MLIDAALPERKLDQRVHRERWNVSFVEHDRIAQRDGAIEVSVFDRNAEDLFRSRAAGAIPIDQAVACDAVAKCGVFHDGKLYEKRLRGDGCVDRNFDDS